MEHFEEPLQTSIQKVAMVACFALLCVTPTFSQDKPAKITSTQFLTLGRMNGYQASQGTTFGKSFWHQSLENDTTFQIEQFRDSAFTLSTDLNELVLSNHNVFFNAGESQWVVIRFDKDRLILRPTCGYYGSASGCEDSQNRIVINFHNDGSWTQTITWFRKKHKSISDIRQFHLVNQ